MPVDVPTIVNKFSPTSVKAGVKDSRSAYWSNYTNSVNHQRGYTDLRSGLGSAAQRVQDFIASNGATNPPFATSTAGRLTPNQGGGNKRITRGYIRRSSPDSGDPASTAQLNFMYNPEEIVRDYASYLDQAALDPFNTVYDSGNLVHAPSFINFNFQLLFDRQIEAAEGSIPKGVLADYEYFDMVVRNVPPGNGANTLPDNGVMMVNPQDITVVFSRDLTVQGRPTNARVRFVKFDSKMVPTRMVVSLTMIITYFGPLRQALSYDAYQDTGDYEALVPYREIYGETYTDEQLRAAQTAYAENQRKIRSESEAAPKLSPYSVLTSTPAYTQIAGVQGISVPANGAVATKAYQWAIQATDGRPGGKPVYSQAAGQRQGPNSFDCSGLVFAALKAVGAGNVLGNDGNTDTIIQRADQGKLAKVWRGRPGTLPAGVAQPGDIFMIFKGETGRSFNHTGFIISPPYGQGGRVNIVHAGSTRSMGTVMNYYDTSDIGAIYRVAATGSSSAGGGNPGGAHWR